eukprot:1134640-Amphidinium_carterae.1
MLSAIAHQHDIEVPAPDLRVNAEIRVGVTQASLSRAQHACVMKSTTSTRTEWRFLIVDMRTRHHGVNIFSLQRTLWPVGKQLSQSCPCRQEDHAAEKTPVKHAIEDALLSVLL